MHLRYQIKQIAPITVPGQFARPNDMERRRSDRSNTWKNVVD